MTPQEIPSWSEDGGNDNGATCEQSTRELAHHVGRIQHVHYCTSREHKSQIVTCDGFKRHENDHEKYYVLLPSGLVETGSDGQLRCALCSASQPDNAHFKEEHNISDDTTRFSPGSRKWRRSDLEKRLQVMNLSAQQIRRLLKKWHRWEKKRAYSCGLCVRYFPTLSQRSVHMCKEHFSKEHDIEAWDEQKEFKGLLLKPDLHTACRREFGKDPCAPDGLITWSAQSCSILKSKIQLGTENMDKIAVEVFEKALYPTIILNPTNLMSPTRDDSTMASAQTLMDLRNEMQPREHEENVGATQRPSRQLPHAQGGGLPHLPSLTAEDSPTLSSWTPEDAETWIQSLLAGYEWPNEWDQFVL